MKEADCQEDNVVGGEDTWQWEGWSGEEGTTPTRSHMENEP